MEFEDIPVGMELESVEMILDKETIDERIELVQWQNRKPLESLGVTAPGLTIRQHAAMQFITFPELRAGIWAKSEHEFMKPMKAGSRIFIRGKIVEKYTKRGRNYVAAAFETRDERGELLIKSIETSVYVE